MNELDEMKVRGYASKVKPYLDRSDLKQEEKDLLEDIFYHLYDIEERGLSSDIRKLRSKTLEQIAITRRIV